MYVLEFSCVFFPSAVRFPSGSRRGVCGVCSACARCRYALEPGQTCFTVCLRFSGLSPLFLPFGLDVMI